MMTRMMVRMMMMVKVMTPLYCRAWPPSAEAAFPRCWGRPRCNQRHTGSASDKYHYQYHHNHCHHNHRHHNHHYIHLGKVNIATKGTQGLQAQRFQDLFVE